MNSSSTCDQIDVRPGGPTNRPAAPGTESPGRARSAESAEHVSRCPADRAGSALSSAPYRRELLDVPGTKGLLTRIQDGDHETWNEVVGMYGRLVRSAARGVLRCDADIDDAVQRTWVQLMTSAGSIADSRKLAGWLSTTARREALAIIRSRVHEIVTDVLDEEPTIERDLDAAYIKCELSTALASAVETLPTGQRAVVKALLRGDMTYDTISAELGIPRGTIGPTRIRAVASLRRSLAAFAA